jgi:hypothetical protein
MVILPGIASSWTRNPQEEWDSAGNDQIMDEDPTMERDFWENHQAHGR